MEPKHVITQVVGIAAAVVLVRWGWNEFRTDWRDKRRLPLVTGPWMSQPGTLGRTDTDSGLASVPHLRQIQPRASS